MQDRMTRAAEAARQLDALFALRRKFLGFLERRIRDREAAEDILQAAYIRALDAEKRPAGGESSLAWFYRILRNAIIDHHRRSVTERSALARWAKELESRPEPSPYRDQTVCACFGLLLDRLPATYRSLLIAVDMEDESLSSYARRQGISAGNAAVRAHRARAALRKSLLQCCGACASHQCMDCTCRHIPVSGV